MTWNESKMLSYPAAISLARLLKSGGFNLVITNGCFDLLHVGHVSYLEAAARLGDQLLVGLNTDWAVTALKGPGRPINRLSDRMRVIAALECVKYVVPVDDMRVGRFITDMEAAVWAKGRDYTPDTLDRAEVEAANRAGTAIKLIPVEHRISTSEILLRPAISE